MPETKNQNLPPKIYKIKTKIWAAAWQGFLNFFNRVFKFFSLRQTRRFWGVVYDSVTKQPLDPVIVKLLYTDGREVETCVTDLAGRYGFLARPGKFKVYARKTNYVFPSLYAPGGKDGVYSNLYHGEFFTLYEDFEVLAPNIPMDPVGVDWNQAAKREMANTHPYLKLFFKRLVGVIFWFGFIFSLLLFWRYYSSLPGSLYWLLGAYAVLFFLRLVLPEPRLWGLLEVSTTALKAEKILLELNGARFAGVSFGKARVHDNGRFLLRAAKGKYVLTFNYIDSRGAKIFLGSLPVSVGSAGVFSASMEIK